MDLLFYEINAKYIDYLSALEPHFFHNKCSYQQNERKYIGIILQVNGMDYFAPLSSFKPKHIKMNECVDFIKIKNYAVLNINNMFPVPKGLYTYINIQKIKNAQYRALLQSEYRIIKKMRTLSIITALRRVLLLRWENDAMIFRILKKHVKTTINDLQFLQSISL